MCLYAMTGANASCLTRAVVRRSHHLARLHAMPSPGSRSKHVDNCFGKFRAGGRPISALSPQGPSRCHHWLRTRVKAHPIRLMTATGCWSSPPLPHSQGLYIRQLSMSTHCQHSRHNQHTLAEILPPQHAAHTHMQTKSQCQLRYGAGL